MATLLVDMVEFANVIVINKCDLVRVYVCVYKCGCVCACVRVCMCACTCVYVDDCVLKLMYRSKPAPVKDTMLPF